MNEEIGKSLPVAVVALSFGDDRVSVIFAWSPELDSRLTAVEQVALSKHLESASNVILKVIVRSLTD